MMLRPLTCLCLLAGTLLILSRSTAHAQQGAPTPPTATTIDGTLLDAQGKPLSGIKMALSTQKFNIWRPQLPGRSWLAGKEINDVWYATSDVDGHFSFPSQQGPYLLLAFTEKGYVLARKSQLTFPLRLQLTPWASLAGTVTIDGRPAPPGLTIQATCRDGFQPKDPADDLGPWPSFTAQTDAQGKFSLDHLLAGRYDIMRNGGGSVVHVNVPPGQVTQVSIPVLGRDIKGRIVLPREIEGLRARDDLPRFTRPKLLPHIVFPENMLQMTPPEQYAWYQTWETTIDGRRHAALLEALQRDRERSAQLGPEGAFAYADVPPGKYVIELQFYALTDKGLNYEQQLATAGYDFTVPAIAGTDLMPLDLGKLSPRPLELTNAGQEAPDIVFPMLDGTMHRLSEFRGKVVLLDFWGTWCGQCVSQLPVLQEIYAAHSKDPRFAMISLSVADEPQTLEKAIREKRMPWTHGILGPREKAWQAAAFDVTAYPSYWLIGPDGHVLAEGWQSAMLRPYLEKALQNMK